MESNWRCPSYLDSLHYLITIPQYLLVSETIEPVFYRTIVKIKKQIDENRLKI